MIKNSDLIIKKNHEFKDQTKSRGTNITFTEYRHKLEIIHISTLEKNKLT